MLEQNHICIALSVLLADISQETNVEIHWNENVVILMKFSSLAALEVVILTTFSAASDENFIKMKTFSFQCKGMDHTHIKLFCDILN